MAEQVQAALDRMVEPLADLQERKVFSPEEIHAIVDRRRQSEYLLKRINVRQEDFLRYIQAETQLEELRLLRVKRMRQEQQRKNPDQPQEITKHIGDKHILQHIHWLWKRTFRKFRADQALYLQYADYLKAKKNQTKLSELYTSVLQIFPREAGWWIEAASHEYFNSGSLQTARVLLQRGLRFNEGSAELWLQYFALELHFIQKMQGRRQVLLQDDQGPTMDQYKIARLVHDNAVKAVKDSVAMRLQFLQQCQQFPHTKELKQYILSKLEEECCQDNPEAWIAAAQSHMALRQETVGFIRDCEAEGEEQEPPTKKQKVAAKNKSKDPVLMLMRKATTNIRKAAMYLPAARLLMAYYEDLEEDGEASRVRQCKDALDNLFAHAKRLKDYSPELVLEHVNFLVRTERLDKAVAVLKKYAPTSDNSAVWRQWVRLVFRPTPKQKDSKAMNILQKGLTKIPMAKSTDYMHLLLETLGLKLVLSAQDTSSLMDRILILAPGCEDAPDIENPVFGVRNIVDGCLQYIMHVIATKDMEKIRAAYEPILFKSSVLELAGSERDVALSKDLFDAVLEAERQNTKPEKKRMERVLQTAIQVFKGTRLQYEYEKLRDEVRFG